eukprot:TRINITY_DN3224_c0_g1_i2.p1 TRINITY_DN3224_c0_g1~~TRINITY_DN3224_c0_g1_i2.p1  ORF type:complete len:581 (+),score=155.13 TRINITY_DN3224_c0_g1_i2:128-1870(+)
MIRRPPRSTLSSSSAASDVYKRQVKSLSCSRYHCMAVDHEGGVYAWGRGEYGQLGLGQRDSERVPTKVRGLEGQRALATGCGWGHTIALIEDGSVYSWGFGGKGQLGHGDMTRHTSPKQISALSNVTQIACGYYHNVIACAEGVFSWGRGERGQLGLGDTASVLCPTKVDSLRGVRCKQLECGDYLSGMLADDGGFWLWGRGTEGQSASPQGPEDKLVPTKQPQLSAAAIVEFSLGWGHCAAVCNHQVAEADAAAPGAVAKDDETEEGDCILLSAEEMQQLAWETGCQYGNFLRYPQMEQARIGAIEEEVIGMLSQLDQFGAVCDTLQFDGTRTSQMIPRLLENAAKLQQTFEAIDQLAEHVDQMATAQVQLDAAVKSSEVENDCESVGSKIMGFFSRAKQHDRVEFNMAAIPDTQQFFKNIRETSGPSRFQAQSAEGDDASPTSVSSAVKAIAEEAVLDAELAMTLLTHSNPGPNRTEEGAPAADQDPATESPHPSVEEAVQPEEPHPEPHPASEGDSPGPEPHPASEDLSKWNVGKLRERLQTLGLDSTGKKKVLLARLSAAMVAEPTASLEPAGPEF